MRDRARPEGGRLAARLGPGLCGSPPAPPCKPRPAATSASWPMSEMPVPPHARQRPGPAGRTSGTPAWTTGRPPFLARGPSEEGRRWVAWLSCGKSARPPITFRRCAEPETTAGQLADVSWPVAPAGSVHRTTTRPPAPRRAGPYRRREAAMARCPGRQPGSRPGVPGRPVPRARSGGLARQPDLASSPIRRRTRWMTRR